MNRKAKLKSKAKVKVKKSLPKPKKNAVKSKPATKKAKPKLAAKKKLQKRKRKQTAARPKGEQPWWQTVLRLRVSTDNYTLQEIADEVGKHYSTISHFVGGRWYKREFAKLQAGRAEAFTKEELSNEDRLRSLTSAAISVIERILSADHVDDAVQLRGALAHLSGIGEYLTRAHLELKTSEKQHAALTRFAESFDKIGAQVLPTVAKVAACAVELIGEALTIQIVLRYLQADTAYREDDVLIAAAEVGFEAFKAHVASGERPKDRWKANPISGTMQPQDEEILEGSPKRGNKYQK